MTHEQATELLQNKLAYLARLMENKWRHEQAVRRNAIVISMVEREINHLQNQLEQRTPELMIGEEDLFIDQNSQHKG